MHKYIYIISYLLFEKSLPLLFYCLISFLINIVAIDMGVTVYLYPNYDFNILKIML